MGKGVTVNFTGNSATGGNAGNGGAGGAATGGKAGDGTHGGSGGDVEGGSGGDAGQTGGDASGGGIVSSGTLTIDPRRGARRRSKHAKATDMITGNNATGGLAGAVGLPGNATPGTGGSPGGAAGQTTAGKPGAAGTAGSGTGGGLSRRRTSTIKNTSTTGNRASTSDNNVFNS
jgi:hypothetical protein